METIGEKLRRLRNYKNLTLEDASKQIGINIKTLSSYENGHRNPGLKTLIKLSKFYDTSIDYLLGKESTNIDRGKILKKLEDIEKQINEIKNHIKSSH